jgi:hypothetical protein
MHGNSTRRLVVASGGDQVVGHVGLHPLGALADRTQATLDWLVLLGTNFDERE